MYTINSYNIDKDKEKIMPGPIFDLEDGDLIIGTCGDIGIDTDGHAMIRLGNNTAMDTETGDIHIVSNWDNNEYKRKEKK